jgi:hypothetical protein
LDIPSEVTLVGRRDVDLASLNHRNQLLDSDVVGVKVDTVTLSFELLRKSLTVHVFPNSREVYRIN